MLAREYFQQAREPSLCSSVIAYLSTSGPSVVIMMVMSEHHLGVKELCCEDRLSDRVPGGARYAKELTCGTRRVWGSFLHAT